MATGADTLIILVLSGGFIVASVGLPAAAVVTAAIGARGDEARVETANSTEEVVQPLLQLAES